MKPRIDINISDQPLDHLACIQSATDPSCGGLSVFIGTVRNSTRGKQVQRLEFEAYAPMAEAEMKKIAGQIVSKWNAHRIVIHHRTGSLSIGDTAVIIAISTPHRKASLEAVQFAIDTLKETVPIWKKEIFDDGEVWVAAHP